jgi:LemA protein
VQFVVLIAMLVIVLIVVAFAIFNRLVRLRNMVRESWRNIDTELQRRYDLIPNLVNTVKGYAAHERAVSSRSRSCAPTPWPSTDRPTRKHHSNKRSAKVLRSSWRSRRAIPI